MASLVSDSDSNRNGNLIKPFSNPPSNYLLYAKKYNLINNLIEDLNDFATKAQFSTIKARNNNYIKDSAL